MRKLADSDAEKDLMKQLSVILNASQPVAQIICKGMTSEDEEVLKILEASKCIALTECNCRSTMNRCDAETEVCIALDAKAVQLIQDKKAKQIDLISAYQIIKDNWKNGLVYLLRFKEGDPNQKEYLCSCCPCCCIYLKPLEQGITSHLLKSEKIICVDTEKCMGCGMCQEICPFDNRMTNMGVGIQNGIGKIDKENCFACGLCARVCPSKASFVKRRS